MQRLGPVVQLLGLGSNLATCIAGGPIAGYYLDEWLGTGRTLTMAGLALGIVVGFYGAYRLITQTLVDMRRWQAAQAPKRNKEKPK